MLLSGLLRDARRSHAAESNEDKIRLCEAEIQQGRLEVAADWIYDIMDEEELEDSFHRQFSLDVFRKASRDKQERMRERMRNLALAPWAGIITTNYDELIEEAIRTHISSPSVQNLFGDERLGHILANSGRLFFVKLHGTLSGIRRILTTEEYELIYTRDSKITAFLTAVMLRYHLVFIGCSLEDELVRLRRRLTADFARRIPRAYAVLPSTERNRTRKMRLLRLARVHTVCYAADDDKHTGVDDFLREAAACRDTLTSSADEPKDQETTLQELLGKPVGERIQSAGETNQQLLRLLARHPEGMRHSRLVSPLYSEVLPQTLSGRTPDELMYRVLFLMAIQLVEERRAGNERRYAVTDEVRAALAGRD